MTKKTRENENAHNELSERIFTLNVNRGEIHPSLNPTVNQIDEHVESIVKQAEERARKDRLEDRRFLREFVSFLTLTLISFGYAPEPANQAFAAGGVCALVSSILLKDKPAFLRLAAYAVSAMITFGVLVKIYRPTNDFAAAAKVVMPAKLPEEKIATPIPLLAELTPMIT